MTTISIQLQKVGEQEIEATADHTVPLPQGQLVRLEGKSPVYGEVVSVSATGGKGKKCDLRIRVIFGKPHLDMDEATLLDSTQLGGELQHMLGSVYSPLFLGETFMGDLVKLGPLSVVSGDSLESKQQALMEIVDGLQAEQRILVVDPLGLFTLAEGYTVHTAGVEVRLSLQSFGVGRFMAHVQQELPPAFQPEAMGLMSDLIPLTLDFIPFKYLMSPSRLPDAPAKAALLHTLYSVYRNQVFADGPEQVFALDAVIPDQLNVLDLSGLHEPWRGIFYQFVCAELLRYKTHGLVPVLIYPENYLPNISETLQKLEECEYNTLVLPSQSGAECLASRANNQFFVERVLGDDHVQVHLKGEMTLGLRVTATLRGLEEDEHEIDLDELEDAVQEAEPEVLSFSPFPDMAPEESHAVSVAPSVVMVAPEEPAQKKKTRPVQLVKPAPQPLPEEEPDAEPEPEEAPEMPWLEAESESDEGLPVEEEVSYEDKLNLADADELEEPDGEDAPFLGEPEDLLDDGVAEAVAAWEAEAEEDEQEAVEDVLPSPHPDSPADEDGTDNDEDDFDFDFESPGGTNPAIEASAPPMTTHEVADVLTSVPGADTEFSAVADEEDDFEFDLPHEVGSAVMELGELPVDMPMHGPTDVGEPEPLASQEDSVPDWDALDPEPIPEKYDNPDAPYLDEIPVVPKAVDDEFVAPKTAQVFAPGDRVKHPKYGYGTVEKVIPMGERVTLKVMFEIVGKRLMDAETSQLTKE